MTSTRTGPVVVSRRALGPRLVEYTLDSPVLGERTGVRILFPVAYGSTSDSRFPVLYLLHGGEDDHRAWTDKGEAAEATEALPMIVVMPDARNGFYSDWEKPGRHGRTPWESFHIGELIPWVDRTFRTLARREGRAAAGLSMGGFGAFSYSARHPELFVAAASFSGVLDTNRHPWITEIAARRDGGGFGAIWGDRLTRSIQWRAHNPWDLAGNLRGMALFVRTGTGVAGEHDQGRTPDAVEAIVFHQSARLHKRLATLAIGHIWHHGRGTHSWPYWIDDLRETAPALAAVFADPPPAPARFTHTCAEPEFEAWGWQLRFSRQHKEFVTMSEVDDSGFVLIGAGATSVRTPAIYEPGTDYKIRVDGPAEARSGQARADREGRLTLPLKLGPGGPTRVEIGVNR